MLEKLLRRKGCSTLAINNFRMWLNYPKRKFSYAPEAIFNSFLKNFIKPARRWKKGRSPFYLNNKNWGLANISFEEISL